MAEAIRKPARRNFQQGNGEVARREDCRHCRRRDVLVLHPPEQVQGIRDPLDRDGTIDGIQREVAVKRGSIGRHAAPQYNHWIPV